jgi:DNA polymerase-3 subunit gamma/tau
MALAQKVPQAVDENLVDREVLQQLATQVSAEDIQLFYQVGLIGRRDLPLAPDPRGGLEMALLRMLAFKPTLEGRATSAAPVATPAIATQNQQPAAAAQVTTQTPPAGVSQAAPVTAPAATQADAPAAIQPTTVLQFDGNWAGLVESLNLRGMVKQLAVNCILREKSSSEVILTLSKENEQLLNPALLKKLEEALCTCLQQKLKLSIELGAQQVESPARTTARNDAERQQSAEESIDQDPMVLALKENFNAEVVPNSVKPVNE